MEDGRRVVLLSFVPLGQQEEADLRMRLGQPLEFQGPDTLTDALYKKLSVSSVRICELMVIGAQVHPVGKEQHCNALVFVNSSRTVSRLVLSQKNLFMNRFSRKATGIFRRA